MFWADKLLENRSGKELINDAWTPSGIMHMGSLKGPVIHDALFKILKEQGRDAKFTFGLDDMDAIDGLPQELKATHEQYMGIPICNAPSPDGVGTFGEYYSNMLLDLFKKLNISAEIYRASDYYKKGIYNKAIQLVLDNADKVRKVYSDMYKKPIAQDWYPLQVICPTCGKVGTTKVIGWDGKEVSFVCKKDMVKWAQGCETTGKVSPFDGRATMPFKVEWAAKWWTFGVTIEGAGKDHASAGGTYDVAMELIDKVFESPKPMKIGYEFFLTGGKKMSSSKGLGLTGEELLEVLSPQAARFLMIKTRPEQAVEFDPRSPDIIPRIYDDYQKGSSLENEDDLRRAFDLSQVGETEAVPSVRFSVLAQWVQMPGMEDEIKKAHAEKWAPYAKIWIEKYAPESEKFLVQQLLPEAVNGLSEQQKEYLSKLSQSLGIKTAEDLQTDIYNLAKEAGISSKEAFTAIYTALLGKDHGPKAAWLIESLDKEFLQKRFALSK